MENEPVLEGQLAARIELTRTDKNALNMLLHDYMPFIKKCLGGIFFKAEARRDYLTEAMLAFIHSAQTYKPESGAFIPYAQVVIRNRLINAVKKEIKLKKSFFSISTNTDEKESHWEEETAERQYTLIQEQKNLQAEIIDINNEFTQWGFDLAALEKNGPKQERSRRTCHAIARKALMNNELITETLYTRKLPVQRLAALTGFSEKILEKYHRYIAAVMVIMRGDYPYMHSFLPHFFDEEDLT